MTANDDTLGGANDDVIVAEEPSTMIDTTDAVAVWMASQGEGPQIVKQLETARKNFSDLMVCALREAEIVIEILDPSAAHFPDDVRAFLQQRSVDLFVDGNGKDGLVVPTPNSIHAVLSAAFLPADDDALSEGNDDGNNDGNADTLEAGE